METPTRQKRKSYSATEKSLLVETYKTSGLSCKQWCTENHISLSTLQRWMQKDWEQKTPQPQQTWIPVVTATEEKSKILSVQTKDQLKQLEKLETENASLKDHVQELELLNKWYTEQLKLSRQKQFGQSSAVNMMGWNS